MARARRNNTLDKKIEKAQNAVYQAKESYDSAVEELNSLLKKKRELQKQKFWKAVESSTRTYDEIMQFLIGQQDSDEE